MGRLIQSEFNKIRDLYIYGRRAHCQYEYDHKHTESEVSFLCTQQLFYYGFHHKLQFSFYLELESQKDDGQRDFV